MIDRIKCIVCFLVVIVLGIIGFSVLINYDPPMEVHGSRWSITSDENISTEYSNTNRYPFSKTTFNIIVVVVSLLFVSLYVVIGMIFKKRIITSLLIALHVLLYAFLLI